MSVQSSSGSLEGPPSWSQLSTSPTPGSAAAARSLLNHTPPSGRPREDGCNFASPSPPAYLCVISLLQVGYYSSPTGSWVLWEIAVFDLWHPLSVLNTLTDISS
ncbi:hypothetical protein FD754_001405, partial [Muntiacus muntjak]